MAKPSPNSSKPLHADTTAEDNAAARKAEYDRLRESHSLALRVQSPTIHAQIAQLQDLCQSWFTNVQGFSRDNFDGDVMLIVTELAEAVEADRTRAKSDKIPEFDGREEELADALVRLLHTAAKYSIRLGPAFTAKMAVNLNRAYKHGKEY
jgi:NTP pyrophosphatase (non-canonical NTP hydrolase)